ncbi:WD40 repeat-like protein [Lentinus brumalis]|uniref:WD40 repeat-like protein n=1 Tax=Lentinus brumalis TaxID=2498619 RepID=A0A371CQ19_9APHY|nr:WD40 repeat-like protein [Polyporus brumalis]
MGRRYKEKTILSGGHDKAVASVAFSLSGNYVATAGLDGRVCVWEAEEGTLLHRYSGKSAALCLAWVPSGEETLLFGTADGNIGMLTMAIALNDLSMSGFWAHRKPIEHIAVTGNLLASGAFTELKVWRWHPLGWSFRCEQSLPEPPKTSHNEHDEMLVTSIHWTGTEYHPLLLVTYMHHGCQCVSCPLCLSYLFDPARASLSPDGSLLAISNLATGFDVYRTDTEQPVGMYRHDVGKRQPTPVLFIHGGQAIVGGSTVGAVNIWDMKLGKLHALTVPSVSPRTRYNVKLLNQLTSPRSGSCSSYSGLSRL